MTLILLLILGCLGLLIAAGLVAGLIYITQSDQRDTVSSAREDWISRRSDTDGEEG
jgi:hypothetical protein